MLLAVGDVSGASAQTTTPLQLVQEYVREMAELDRLHGIAESNQKKKPDFMACIRDNAAFDLELGTSISRLNGMRLALTPSDLNDVPSNVATFYQSKREEFRKMGAICTAFVTSQEPGYNYGALAAEAPKITAKLAFLDHSIFQTASPLVFFTLIDQKPDSQNHLSHIVIIKAERKELVRTIDLYFGKKLKLENQKYTVATARLFREKLLEYKCSDEP